MRTAIISKVFSLVTLLLMVSMIVGDIGSSAAPKSFPYTIFVDGNKVDFATANQPFVHNGVAVVPFRPLLAQLGFEVTWKRETKQVIGTSADLKIVLTVDSKKASLNGKTVNMTSAPLIQNGTTYVPLRFLVESSGGELQLYGEDGGHTAWVLSAKQVGLKKAVMDEDIAAVEKLLREGADPAVGIGPSGPTIYTFTPYESDNVAMVSLYLQYGMDVNAKDPVLGMSILHDAVLYGRLNMVRVLLEHGADPTADSLMGTPIEMSERSIIASEPNATAISELLKSYSNKEGE